MAGKLGRYPTFAGREGVDRAPTAVFTGRIAGLPAALTLLVLALAATWASPGLFSSPAAAQAEALDVPIGYLTKQEKAKIPLSLLDPILEDDGLWGARLGLKDNQTTGQFLKHDYRLTETLVEETGDVAAAFKAQAAEGVRLFLADLRAEDLEAIAGLPEAAEALIFNVRASDDALRNEACRGNVFHITPSRAMKADALAQYLMWKKWNKWVLIHGKDPRDLAFAEALKRSAKKFGAKVVEERPVDASPDAARTDSGHVQIQQQIPVMTQGAPDHDVLVVSDEADNFGEYLPYRTWDARPVAGTQGLVPTAWHRSHEQWGGTQIQRRFEKLSERDMTPRDYANWAAMRAIGEAVTRTKSADAAEVKAFLLGDTFKLAAFKGDPLTFRRWNQQLRQPVLLAAARSLVSVSPQAQYLHERTPLDTLGFDESESECGLN